jgi:hypothetical protein
MLSQQTRYTPPREEQYPTPPEDNERFVGHTVGVRNPRIVLMALSVALVIVSMAMMVGTVNILLTDPVYAELGSTGALIGIGIAGFVLVCINVVVDYLMFTLWKR